MHLKHILKDMKKVKLPSAGWYAFTLLLFSGFLVFEVARMSYAQTAFKYPTALPPNDNPTVTSGGGGTVAYDECKGSMFSTFTKTTDTYEVVNNGGYVAVNNACNSAKTGSHVCSAAEIMNTIRCKFDTTTGEITPFSLWDTQLALITMGAPGSMLSPVNDCQGWKSPTASMYASVWKFSKINGGYGLVGTCSNYKTKRFACCIAE